MKCIDLMTLYMKQPCFGGGDKYIEIRKVYDKEKRMGKPIGDINLTDYWFELVESEKKLGGQYIGQHFCLLSDENEEQGREEFWKRQKNKSVAICLIKIRSDFLRLTKDGVKKLIMRKLRQCDSVEGKFFYTVDNADLILFVFADDEKMIQNTVEKLKDIHFAGKNVFYSFYNMNGRIQIENGEKVERKVIIKNPHIDNKPIQKFNYIYNNSWCLSKIRELQDKIDVCICKKNRKWVSYYQTLRQILNLLCQYEQENKFKDLFYIFYPAMYLFLEQLEKGMGDAENSSEEIETTVSDFVDSMEILIHHIGISCVNILNVDGRNGLPYDIPVKLCLLYLAALHTIVNVLNDEGHKYQFCLSPLAYSRPRTNIFEFGLTPTDRLIRVSIARHKLYSPRALLGILTHEVSHYVGSYRMRKQRAEHYMTVCSAILLEKLYPQQEIQNIVDKFQLDETEKNAFCEDWRNRKGKIFSYFKKEMHWRVKHSNTLEAQKYHFAQLCETIKDIITEFMYDSEHKLQHYMNEVDYELKRKLGFVKEDSSLFDACEEAQGMLNRNLLKTAIEGDVYVQMDNVKYVFKETYADISAVMLLKIKPVDYLEDYILSEGCILREEHIYNQLTNRVALVTHTMSGIDDEWKSAWEQLDAEALNQNKYLIALKREADRYLKCFQDDCDVTVEEEEQVQKEEESFEVFMMEEVVEAEKNYLEMCAQALKERFELPEISEAIMLLQKMYEHFATHGQKEFKEFFDIFDETICAFKKDIQEEWKVRDGTGK